MAEGYKRSARSGNVRSWNSRFRKYDLTDRQVRSLLLMVKEGYERFLIRERFGIDDKTINDVCDDNNVPHPAFSRYHRGT